jgi:hypothetical protein
LGGGDSAFAAMVVLGDQDAGVAMRDGWSMKRVAAKLAAPSGLLGLVWFVVDHFLPDLLLPKVPESIKWAIAGVALAFGAGVGFWIGVEALLRRCPPPWACSPIWRLGDWLRQRPRLSILVAPVQAIQGLIVLEGAKASLTLQRNASRTRRPTRILLDGARLVLTQRRPDQTITWVFVVEEAGGFLAMPVKAGSDDNVIATFRATGFPKPMSQLVDFARPFELILTGAEAIIGEDRPLRGGLPAARWSWPGAAPGTSIVFPDERSF